MTSRALRAAVLFLAVSLAACGGSGGGGGGGGGPFSHQLYAVTTDNTLLAFDTTLPSALLVEIPITGLVALENVVGLDFRPATLELFAVTDQSRLYELDPSTGAASLVGVGPFAPLLVGTAFGVDFSPTSDRLRVVSDADENLRIDPDTGTAFADVALAYALGDPNSGTNPLVSAIAYTNNAGGAIVTTLFGIDATTDALVRIGGVDGTPSPNGGVLTTIGPLGVDADTRAGFDVTDEGAVAYAAFGDQLYEVNLATGAVSLLGTIGDGSYDVVGISAIPPVQ